MDADRGLKEKARGGIIDVLLGVLEDPEIRVIIRRVTAVFMTFLSCAIVGTALIVYAVLKLVDLNWMAGTIIGLALLGLGTIYTHRALNRWATKKDS